jgi:hypothetical protein
MTQVSSLKSQVYINIKPKGNASRDEVILEMDFGWCAFPGSYNHICLDEAGSFSFFNEFPQKGEIESVTFVILSEAKNLSRRRSPRGDSSLRSE